MAITCYIYQVATTQHIRSSVRRHTPARPPIVVGVPTICLPLELVATMAAAAAAAAAPAAAAAAPAHVLVLLRHGESTWYVCVIALDCGSGLSGVQGLGMGWDGWMSSYVSCGVVGVSGD